MSHQSSSLSEEDGLNHNGTNGFLKTNGNGAHYEDKDTPMSEDDDVPLVCNLIFLLNFYAWLKLILVDNSWPVADPDYSISEAEEGRPGFLE